MNVRMIFIPKGAENNFLWLSWSIFLRAHGSRYRSEHRFSYRKIGGLIFVFRTFWFDVKKVQDSWIQSIKRLPRPKTHCVYYILYCVRLMLNIISWI